MCKVRNPQNCATPCPLGTTGQGNSSGGSKRAPGLEWRGQRRSQGPAAGSGPEPVGVVARLGGIQFLPPPLNRQRFPIRRSGADERYAGPNLVPQPGPASCAVGHVPCIAAKTKACQQAGLPWQCHCIAASPPEPTAGNSVLRQRWRPTCLRARVPLRPSAVT